MSAQCFAQHLWTFNRKGEREVNDDYDLLAIPDGMTKLFQLLDVINQPVKVAFWQLYKQWMTTTSMNVT
jgi:hypothetical protein